MTIIDEKKINKGKAETKMAVSSTFKIFLVVFFLFFSITLVSAESFGYSYLEPGENLNEETYINYTQVNVNKSNFTDSWITSIGVLNNTSDITSNGMWTRTGTSLHPTNIGDFVGVGLTNPSSALEINASLGNITYKDSDGNYLSISRVEALGTAYMLLGGHSLEGVAPTDLIAMSNGLLIMPKTQDNPTLYFTSNESDGFSNVVSMTFNFSDDFFYTEGAGAYQYDGPIIGYGVGLAPAFIPSPDDLDSGFGSAAENVIGFVAGGKVQYISNGTSGNTAIGFVSASYNPLNKLDINGTTNVSKGNFIVNENSLFVNWTNGRVGVGTSSPKTILHISGTNPYLRINSGNGELSVLQFAEANAERGTFFYSGSSNVINLYNTLAGKTMQSWYDNGDIYLNGNVGINTINPQQALDVVGGINGSKNLTIKNTAGAGIIRGEGTAGAKLQLGNSIGTGNLRNYQFDSRNDRIDLARMNDAWGSTLDTIMTWDNTGYVGINTTSPQNTLNVVGDLNVTGNFINGVNTGLTGNYSRGECWDYISGGIITATNCTAL